jgi:citronellol/citronellal dehydrogenase
MAAEFRDFNISVNALWPQTSIATAAVKNHLGGEESIRRSRTEAILVDSAYLILTSKPTSLTGQFIIVY